MSNLDHKSSQESIHQYSPVSIESSPQPRILTVKGVEPKLRVTGYHHAAYKAPLATPPTPPTPSEKDFGAFKIISEIDDTNMESSSSSSGLRETTDSEKEDENDNNDTAEEANTSTPSEVVPSNQQKNNEQVDSVGDGEASISPEKKTTDAEQPQSAHESSENPSQTQDELDKTSNTAADTTQTSQENGSNDLPESTANQVSETVPASSKEHQESNAADKNATTNEPATIPIEQSDLTNTAANKAQPILLEDGHANSGASLAKNLETGAASNALDPQENDRYNRDEQIKDTPDEILKHEVETELVKEPYDVQQISDPVTDTQPLPTEEDTNIHHNIHESNEGDHDLTDPKESGANEQASVATTNDISNAADEATSNLSSQEAVEAKAQASEPAKEIVTDHATSEQDLTDGHVDSQHATHSLPASSSEESNATNESTSIETSIAPSEQKQPNVQSSATPPSATTESKIAHEETVDDNDDNGGIEQQQADKPSEDTAHESSEILSQIQHQLDKTSNGVADTTQPSKESGSNDQPESTPNQVSETVPASSKEHQESNAADDENATTNEPTIIPTEEPDLTSTANTVQPILFADGHAGSRAKLAEGTNLENDAAANALDPQENDRDTLDEQTSDPVTDTTQLVLTEEDTSHNIHETTARLNEGDQDLPDPKESSADEQASVVATNDVSNFADEATSNVSSQEAVEAKPQASDIHEPAEEIETDHATSEQDLPNGHVDYQSATHSLPASSSEESNATNESTSIETSVAPSEEEQPKAQPSATPASATTESKIAHEETVDDHDDNVSIEQQQQVDQPSEDIAHQHVSQSNDNALTTNKDQAQIDKLQQNMQNLQQTIETQSMSYMQIEAQLEDKATQLEDSERQKEELTEQLTAMKKTLNDQQLASNNEIKLLNQTLQALKDNNKQLQDQLVTKEDLNTQLKKQLDSLIQKLADSQALQDQRITTLEQELQEERKAKQSLENQLVQLNEEIRTRRLTQVASDTENKRLHQQLQLAHSENLKFENQHQQGQSQQLREKKQVEQRQQSLETENERLKLELHEIRDLYLSLQDEAAKLKTGLSRISDLAILSDEVTNTGIQADQSLIQSQHQLIADLKSIVKNVDNDDGEELVKDRKPASLMCSLQWWMIVAVLLAALTIAFATPQLTYLE